MREEKDDSKKTSCPSLNIVAPSTLTPKHDAGSMVRRRTLNLGGGGRYTTETFRAKPETRGEEKGVGGGVSNSPSAKSLLKP